MVIKMGEIRYDSDEYKKATDLQFRYETDERVLKIQEFYSLFCNMSDAMQRIIKDIMIRANNDEGFICPMCADCPDNCPIDKEGEHHEK